MRWLPALSRVALVCNVFFLLGAALQWKSFIQTEAVVSTIVVAGYFMAPFVVSPLVVLLYAVQWRLRRNLFVMVPRWLVVVNAGFFVVQALFILFYFNDTIYN